MFKKTIHFIKYHNAVAIGISLISVLTVSAFAASPAVRESFISSQDIPMSVDNSYILTVNLDNFSFALQIKNITEDQDNYYITYTYKTIYIQDYVWQEVDREKILTISKTALGDDDLGLYVAEELGENINYELSYLKEVQRLEKEKGLTQKIVTTQYAGLIGKLLDPKDKVFPGYAPVVAEEIPQPQIIGEYTPSIDQEAQVSSGGEESLQITVVKETIDKETIRQVIQEILTQQKEQASASAETSSTPTSAEVSANGEVTEDTPPSTDITSSGQPENGSPSTEQLPAEELPSEPSDTTQASPEKEVVSETPISESSSAEATEDTQPTEQSPAEQPASEQTTPETTTQAPTEQTPTDEPAPSEQTPPEQVQTPTTQ